MQTSKRTSATGEYLLLSISTYEVRSKYSSCLFLIWVAMLYQTICTLKSFGIEQCSTFNVQRLRWSRHPGDTHRVQDTCLSCLRRVGCNISRYELSTDGNYRNSYSEHWLRVGGTVCRANHLTCGVVHH